MFSLVRLAFARRYAGRHLLISLFVAVASAAVVFGLWYPPPYRQLLDVGHIYLHILAVDVVCGPLLTLILASPRKSRRERWLDFSLVGVMQLVALVYGMHSVWTARPVALVFEVDRLVVVTANEVQVDALGQAPAGLRQLPWAGVLHAGTREPADGAEMLESVQLGLSGVSPALRPDWWLSWDQARTGMRERAQPLQDLISSRPHNADVLLDAARSSGHAASSLIYLPLVSSKSMDWVALLDAQQNMVGWAPVDGF